MNKRSLKYVLVFDKLKIEKRMNESKKVLTHEWILVIKQKPICLRKHEEIIKEDYVVFYINGLTIDWKELSTIKHTSVEEQLEFKATVLVSRSAYSDHFYTGNKSNKVQLYFLRVFILGNREELRLEYLDFVTSIVDSGNLPLHISCEVLQPSKPVKVICKNLVKTLVVIEFFFEIAHNKEGYYKYYGAFSNNFMIGSGTCEDLQINEKIVKLINFSPSKSSDEITTLKDYVIGVKEGQNDNSYISDEGTKLVENSSSLEKLAKKGYKVPYMLNTIDECVAGHLSMARLMSSNVEINYWKSIVDDFVVSVARVWVECGLLSKAFMYQRMTCAKLRERKMEDYYDEANEKLNDWLIWLEILVFEFCCLFIKEELLLFIGQDPLISSEARRCVVDPILSLLPYALLQCLVCYLQAHTLILPMPWSALASPCLQLPIFWILIFNFNLGETGNLELLTSVRSLCITMVSLHQHCHIPHFLGAVASVLIGNELGGGDMEGAIAALGAVVIVSAAEFVVASGAIYARCGEFEYAFIEWDLVKVSHLIHGSKAWEGGKIIKGFPKFDPWGQGSSKGGGIVMTQRDKKEDKLWKLRIESEMRNKRVGNWNGYELGQCNQSKMDLIDNMGHSLIINLG